jgi:hypothetical protein
MAGDAMTREQHDALRVAQLTLSLGARGICIALANMEREPKDVERRTKMFTLLRDVARDMTDAHELLSTTNRETS